MKFFQSRRKGTNANGVTRLARVTDSISSLFSLLSRSLRCPHTDLEYFLLVVTSFGL